MKRVCYYSIFFLLVLVISHCIHTVQKRPNLKQYFDKPALTFSKIDFEIAPKKEDYPQSDAVFLLREAKYKVDKIFTFTEHIVIKIFNDAGKRYANVRIPFWSDISDVVYLEARTIKSNGEVINLDRKDVFEVSDFPDFMLYADSRAKVFTFPGVDTNCIIEYIYTIGLTYPYVPMWYFQAEEPVVYAKFSYEVPVNLGFKYLYSNLPGKEIKKEISDYPGWNCGSLSVRNLPGLKKEPFSPPLTGISSWLFMTWSSLRFLFQEFTSREESWALIGQDYKKAIDKILKPDKEIKQKSNELIKDCKTEEEKIRTIAGFIQKNFRYVAVSIQGHRALPNSPSKVLGNLYGDCKDLSGLFISLLNAAGIDAYPVLIRTKDIGNLIENFPSRNQINHVIVAIPLKYFDEYPAYSKATVLGENDFSRDDDFVIFDPTAKTVPLGRLHSLIQGGNAVICTDDNSPMVTLPEFKHRDNVVLSKILFNPEKEVSSGIITIQISGEEASRLRWNIINLPANELHNHFQKYLNGIPAKVILDTFEVKNLNDLDSNLKIILKFKKAGSLQTHKEQVLIPVIFTPLKYFGQLHHCSKREYHINLDFPYYQNDTYKVIISKKYPLTGLVEKDNISNEWFDYSLSSYSSGDTVVVNRVVAVKSSIIPKEKFEEIKGCIEKIVESNHKFIILTKRK